jgi:hypothetical protein
LEAEVLVSFTLVFVDVSIVDPLADIDGGAGAGSVETVLCDDWEVQFGPL